MDPRNRLETYALAAAALSAGIACSSHAAVVTSGPVSIVAPATLEGLYLNVRTGATGTSSGTTAGWDIRISSASSLNLNTPAPYTSSGIVRLGTATTPNTFAANLAGGVLVGDFPEMWFATSFVLGSTNSPAGRAFQLNSTSNYVGFRFLNEATNAVHYGFVRLSIGASLTSRTIIEYAYEDVAGAAIFVPAPGGAALLGAAALAARRRRRA